jgi:K+-transporting ATPase KdpF subunit
MIATFLVITVKTSGMNFTHEYIIGAIIALFIMGYLVYALIKPEKF